MSFRFFDLMFTPSVKAAQEANGSRKAYARMDGAGREPQTLGEREKTFIQGRDSFYMATVNEDGWPYVQHRGGPSGFVRILDDRTLALPDFRGNRQYVSVGNLRLDDRVSLFFMDYPNRARLKVMARMRTVDLEDDPNLAALLQDDDYGAHIERGLKIVVEAFDWNCPQHITPRFTEQEVERALQPLRAHVEALEAALREAGLPVPTLAQP